MTDLFGIAGYGRYTQRKHSVMYNAIVARTRGVKRKCKKYYRLNR